MRPQEIGIGAYSKVNLLAYDFITQLINKQLKIFERKKEKRILLKKNFLRGGHFCDKEKRHKFRSFHSRSATVYKIPRITFHNMVRY